MLVIWISAFIPLNAPGSVRIPVAAPGAIVGPATGPHIGKTALPLPFLARIPNPFKHGRAGHLTDQRDFLPTPAASHRMQCLLEIDELSGKSTPKRPSSSGTTEVDIATGHTLGTGVADMSRCSFKLISFTPGPITSMQARLDAKASDPLVVAAADIDFRFTYNITYVPAVRSLTIQYDGVIEPFPSFESYATFNGTTKELFKVHPAPDKTVNNIIKDADVPQSGTVAFP